MYSVLYVDDEAGLLEVGKLFLENMGQFSVDTVTSATGALPALDAKNYDAIIADYQMPVMDGIEFLRRVRTSGNDIPFILFTGRGREEIVIRALNEGADFYLQKGGDPTAQFAELAHKIRQAVQRRQAVLALGESERRYREVVETQSDFICRFLPDGTHVFVNEAYCRYFRAQRDEIIGHRFVPPIPAEDQEGIRRHLAALTPAHPSAEIEHRVIMPDGSVRWQWWSDRAIFDREGRVTEFQSIGKDITDRKQAEEALKESEEKYRTAIEKTREAVIIAQDGCFAFANESMGRLTGCPPETLIGKPFIDFIWPDDRPLVRDRFRKRVAGEDVPDAYDFRVIGAGGRARWVTISAARISWKGRPATLNMLTDITERKQAEAELEERQEKFFAAFTINPDPLAITDPITGTILEANPAFSQFSGYAPEELIGKTTQELNIWVDQHERDAVLRSLQAHEEVTDREIRFRARSGKIDDCLFSARFITIGGKEHLFTRARNITERKRTENLLKERESMLTALLNTPPDSIVLLDRGGVIMNINDAGAGRLGGTVQEITGRCAYQLLPAETARSRKALIDRVFESGEPARFDDGRSGMVIHNEIFPIFTADRTSVEYVAIFAREINGHT